MFLVVIHWFWNNSHEPIILTRTKEKAKEFIKDYEDSRQLGGFVAYEIEKVNIYD